MTAVLIAFLALAAAAQQPEAPVATLPDAYALALRHSEIIAINETSIRQAEALYRRALGSSLPELSLRHESSWEEGAKGEGQGMARLAWTGLSGYRELAAIRGARALSGQREAERLRAEQLLLANVAAAFYGLLQAQENVATTDQLKDLAERRLAELRERVRVGRAREADAIGQEFQLASLQSQLEESGRQVGARVDLLLYLTRASSVAPRNVDSTFSAPRPVESYLSRVEARPDVAAASRAAETAAASVRVARAARFPQLGVTANYYGYRPASRRETDWDAGLNVSLPLWSWGARRAGVAEADASRRQAELALQAVRRQAELDIRNAHRDFSVARRQLELLQRAVDLARRDYELQRRDESRGLVTALEVLESLNRLNTSRLSSNGARLQLRLAAIALELAAGARPQALSL